MKCPLPLFFVHLFPQVNNKDIHYVTPLLNIKVGTEVEKPYNKRWDPPQYHNCQVYGHTHIHCHHESRCDKCGENYHNNECTKDCNCSVKCVICTKDHTTNFEKWTTFKSAFKSPLQKPFQSKILIIILDPKPNHT